MTDRSTIKPPPLWEIVALPAIGAVIIAASRTRHNELELLAIPFVVCVVRLYVAQFQSPPSRNSPQSRRLARSSVALNQFAVLVLMALECAVVIVTNPTVDASVWIVPAVIFLVYAGMRLISRRLWIAAARTTAGDPP